MEKLLISRNGVWGSINPKNSDSNPYPTPYQSADIIIVFQNENCRST